MQTLMSHLRLATAQFTCGRVVVVAMLCPIVGALLAFGAVAMEEAKEVTIGVGTTVKLGNHDDISHNLINENKVFRLKALDTDDSYSFTFASAGTHDSITSAAYAPMQGKIIVK